MKYMHNNISPLDNRYAHNIQQIRDCFSEYSLIKHRLTIEIDWMIYLCTKYPQSFGKISKTSINKLLDFKNNFDNTYVKKIKNIEKNINHDVKAIEYFIADFCSKDSTLKNYINLIHFGLTSEDINSLSYAIMIKEGINIYLDKINGLRKLLTKSSNKWNNIPLLCRTHGQPASPSTLGKEIKVFSKRMEREILLLSKIKPLAKFSGATGNYHTFDIVNNKINWPKFNKKFINSYKIQQNEITTQIEPHDWIAETLQILTRLNNICIDFSTDIWIYISNDIFNLKVIKKEVGSSTMPHKINPIDFENAEGNFGLSNSMNNYFVNKLTKSRLQRDLSDSTVLRNIGMSFGYSGLALESLKKGFNKLQPNKKKILDELNNNWEILAEPIQTIMRYEGYPDAYDQLKLLTRGNKLNKDTYKEYVTNLKISKSSKNKLLKLSPATYIGLANKL